MQERSARRPHRRDTEVAEHRKCGFGAFGDAEAVCHGLAVQADSFTTAFLLEPSIFLASLVESAHLGLAAAISCQGGAGECLETRS